jgi:homogentisate 1,2-dioxygenase
MKRGRTPKSSDSPTSLTAEVSSKREKSVSSSSSAVPAHSTGTVVEESGLSYMSGFGGYFQSSALPGALPVGQTNPQVCNYKLYAELFSGTTFTTPRCSNQRTWFYRIRPTAAHKPFQPLDSSSSLVSSRWLSDFSSCHITPQQLRWNPFPIPPPANQKGTKKINFLQGVSTICGCGSPETKTGLSILVYGFNSSMSSSRVAMCNSDGDFLFVPQLGTLNIQTETGLLTVAPGEIAVIQRGLTFSINHSVNENGEAYRGYILEVFNGHFRLPELGPIGSNGLAQPRDFLHPTAHFEDSEGDFTVIQKFCGKFFSFVRPASPFDVVAWHGNYVPYKYDLSKFCPVGAVRLDHLDPSIFTVLTCPTAEPGVACADFVIFPPRWAVQEDTFRIPYYHRNVASEFMGNIKGHYEAKPNGFVPGGGSLHSIGAGHGPDAESFAVNTDTSEPLKPQRLPDDSLSFMFESTFFYRVTDWALNSKEAAPQADYFECWQNLKSNFDGKP